jgi:NAD dependent epimerase/dehydratase family enzyme
VWLQAGTATIYAHSLGQAHDDITGIIGGTEVQAPDKWRFSIDVARAWEGEFALLELPDTRKVVLRSAMVMSPDKDGVFDYLLWLVRMSLGGTAGSGDQYISWIHDEDFIRAVSFLIDHHTISGAVNIASPQPLPNRDFMRELRMAWGTKIGLPAYEWMLEVGAVLLQTESELVLKSRRVVPKRLLDNGFEFRFSEWAAAAKDLCDRVRQRR